MTVTSRRVVMLAVGATGTSLCLSVLAGWQRGGSLAEKLVWIAISVVLVVSAHLLPSLIREAPILLRGVGSLLWGACLATACYGHAVFFVLAQQHAGELRASTVTVVNVPPPTRSLTVVMAERATVTRQLAFAQAQRCPRDCSALDARRITLTAKLDALNAEAGDTRRRQAADDRTTVLRDSLRADPVTSRFAALLGTTTARIDLVSGLMFAAVLEGVACLLWTVALRPYPMSATVTTVTSTTLAAVTLGTPDQADETVSGQAVTGSHAAMTSGHAPRDNPVAPLPDTEASSDDMTRLAQDIAVGHVRPTVADIRRHLGCSQARAVTLRRQLAGRNVTA